MQQVAAQGVIILLRNTHRVVIAWRMALHQGGSHGIMEAWHGITAALGQLSCTCLCECACGVYLAVIEKGAIGARTGQKPAYLSHRRGGSSSVGGAGQGREDKGFNKSMSFRDPVPRQRESAI